MPIFMLQATLPMSEVRLWQAYFDTEKDRYELTHWYFAMLAMTIERSQSTKPRTWNVADYLLKWREQEPIRDPVADTKKVRGWLGSLFTLGRRK